MEPVNVKIKKMSNSTAGEQETPSPVIDAEWLDEDEEMSSTHLPVPVSSPPLPRWISATAQATGMIFGFLSITSQYFFRKTTWMPEKNKGIGKNRCGKRKRKHFQQNKGGRNQ